MATTPRPDHDTLYHRLFSHPGVVAQLLRGFVNGPWLDDLDLEGMERQNTTFHAAARAVFAELLGALIAPLGPQVRFPDDLREVRNMLATRAEQWKQAWRLEGLEEGRQEGRQAGEAAVLLRLLDRRFGPLPDWVADRVRSADIVDLEQWSTRILDARFLDEIVGAPPE